MLPRRAEETNERPIESLGQYNLNFIDWQNEFDFITENYQEIQDYTPTEQPNTNGKNTKIIEVLLFKKKKASLHYLKFIRIF